MPSDFFDAPRRADALVFLDQLVRLVLGFDAGINSKEDLRVFLTEHSLRLPRGTLHPTMPVGMAHKQRFFYCTVLALIVFVQFSGFLSPGSFLMTASAT